MTRFALALLLPLLLMLPRPGAAGGFDFSDYRILLERYLVSDRQIDGVSVNVLDYQRMQQEQDRVGTPYLRLLMSLGEFDPATLDNDRAQRMAFWINVYNIAAIKTVLDHYPVDSIRSRRIDWLRRPWKRKAIKVGNRLYSLKELEEDVLVAGFGDLRIYLAINCATVSSPDLRPAPYRAPVLEEQLREQGERLAAQPGKGLRVRRGQTKVEISEILRFQHREFASRGGAIAFLLPYVDDPATRDFLEKGDYELDYLDYDWTLNDLKLVDR